METVIIISLLILALIVVTMGYNRKRKAKKLTSHLHLRREPLLDDELMGLQRLAANNNSETRVPHSTVMQPADNDMQENTLYILHVLAKKHQFISGYLLLQELLAADLRYGAKKIFHRFEQTNGHGNILFSVASATEPGIFDLQYMANQQFSGITLFMDCSALADPAQAKTLMFETAVRLADALGCRLMDQHFQLIQSLTTEKADAITMID